MLPTAYAPGTVCLESRWLLDCVVAQLLVKLRCWECLAWRWSLPYWPSYREDSAPTILRSASLAMLLAAVSCATVAVSSSEWLLRLHCKWARRKNKRKRVLRRRSRRHSCYQNSQATQPVLRVSKSHWLDLRPSWSILRSWKLLSAVASSSTTSMCSTTGVLPIPSTLWRQTILRHWLNGRRGVNRKTCWRWAQEGGAQGGDKEASLRWPVREILLTWFEAIL